MLRHAKLAVALSIGLLFAGTSSATLIVIAPDPGLAANAAALAAFNRAATRWGNLFSDAITVTIDARFALLANPNTIGSASSFLLQGDYNVVRNQMVADAANEASNAVVAALPTAAQFSGFLPTGFSFNNAIAGTKANFKAMGFTGLDAAFGASDATITFNSGFTFDFDNSDGVTAGAQDFETVALHEIGHALGFVSAVDTVDFMRSNGTVGAVSMMALDLFRFGANAPTTLANFTTASRNLVSGAAAHFNDLDNQWSFSTGVATGDGRQASHWKDDSLTGNHIGIMDPTLSSGTMFPIDFSDIRALDLIGWDLAAISAVPEPGAISLVLLALWASGFATRRRRGA